MARLRKPLDWLNTSGVVAGTVWNAHFELSQQQQLQLSSGDGDQLQPELQKAHVLQLIGPVQVVVETAAL